MLWETKSERRKEVVRREKSTWSVKFIAIAWER